MTIKEEYNSILEEVIGWHLCSATNDYLDRRLTMFFQKHHMHDFKYKLIQKHNSIEVIPIGNLSRYALMGILST